MDLLEELEDRKNKIETEIRNEIIRMNQKNIENVIKYCPDIDIFIPSDSEFADELIGINEVSKKLENNEFVVVPISHLFRVLNLLSDKE